ncbi:divalent-cation tolerance protein CutA [Ramlibacter tataouinensis]|uniref:Periplasmic divalent cation tolerance protein-like protein n=1 Tax=Ramlibacter tataouinensis (strain ATCC BAA-407 / DSM 14655 / LMG 21543 / TTB310) TaxID=365046 RepID=F5XZB7_RAMTT|nr:divalent-cation tolerance protein CutA [Ramlibacter tataouinensis]AEG94474.1 periplasmic divalent cation tolerance protein-like protein [Ramlibacter tataouinensis TTB310]
MSDGQEQPEVLSLVTTLPSQADAQRLAQALLSRRLAACVQVEPGLLSHYRWEGRECADAEARVTLKTLPQCLDALLAFLAEHHPYELPQLLWQRMASTPAYAAWVRGCVEVPAGEKAPGT